MGTTPKGYTQIANDGPMQGPQQINDAELFLENLIGETVATVSALPSSGNWIGRHVFVQSDARDYVWGGTAWLSGTPTQLQVDTTNSVIQAVTQVGAGKILGNSTVQALETVTFPLAFATVPRIVITATGYRPTGAFNDVGLSISTNYAAAGIKSTTGFTAVINMPSGTLANTLDYYYDWAATGVLA